MKSATYRQYRVVTPRPVVDSGSARVVLGVDSRVRARVRAPLVVNRDQSNLFSCARAGLARSVVPPAKLRKIKLNIGRIARGPARPRAGGGTPRTRDFEYRLLSASTMRARFFRFTPGPFRWARSATAFRARRWWRGSEGELNPAIKGGRG